MATITVERVYLDYLSEGAGNTPLTIEAPVPPEGVLLRVGLQARQMESGTVEPWPALWYSVEFAPESVTTFRTLHVAFDGISRQLPAGVEYIGTVTWPGVPTAAHVYAERGPVTAEEPTA